MWIILSQLMEMRGRKSNFKKETHRERNSLKKMRVSLIKIERVKL